MPLDRIKRIESVAMMARRECFASEIQEQGKHNRAYGRILKETGLGISLCQWTLSDGPKILRVFQAALVEADLGEEADIVQAMIDAHAANEKIKDLITVKQPTPSQQPTTEPINADTPTITLQDLTY